MEVLLEAEFSKAQNRELSGSAFEELWAESTGGTRIPPRARGQRGPDCIAADGETAVQLKTLGVRPVASRPEARDWVGQLVQVPVCRVRPAAPLPRGRGIETVSAQALGDRVIRGLNEATAEWDRIAFLVRVPCPQPEETQCLYWELDVDELDPREWSWVDAPGERLSPWDRNLHGRRRPAPRGRQAEPAELAWCSGGIQLYQRFVIPTDPFADVLRVSQAMVLTRAEATRAVLDAARTRLLAA